MESLALFERPEKTWIIFDPLKKDIMTKLILTVLLAVLGSWANLHAQTRFFSDMRESEIQLQGRFRSVKPSQYRTTQLRLTEMRDFLRSLPSESEVLYRRNQAPVLYLPMPDGTEASFHVWESSIQEPALEARFPGIRTYAGQGISDPYATLRFDMTERGFHAQVIRPGGTYYIDPFAVGDLEHYQSYFRRDNVRNPGFACEFTETAETLRPLNITAPCRGTELKTYRLAVACTGEYAQAPGIAAGTNAATLHSAIVTTVNRVVGVYELELAIRMVLIANNNIIEYLNAATDPFNGNNNANTLIGESQTVINSNIGAANYDIGHTFSTGGGGLAGLGVVCNNSQKARGITGSPSPTGDSYDIDYVAHEMGHQFGGNHSMNGCGNSPNSTKYEPGSGTTIMAYAGICGAQDIQPNSDPTFHAVSFDEISNFLNAGGAGCGVITPTGNTLPVINPLPQNGLSIPPGTPFTLNATATDADGDPLTYCWEEWDLGNPGSGWNIGLTAGAGNTAPLFKSRLPKITGTRQFPDQAIVLANYPANPPAAMNGLKGEILSPVARPMNFRLTVRDNRAAGGGIVSSGGAGCQTATSFVVNVVGTAPFAVSVPNGGESYPGGSSQTVTWNVAGTNAAPVNTTQVRILLSTDGGLTFPTVLLASTVNDGSEAVTLPGPASTITTARIKVEALNNIFFDISNANFTINQVVAGFSFDSPAAGTVTCGNASSAVITLGTASLGGFTTPINLTASGNPAGTTVSFGTNPLVPGSSTTVSLGNTVALSSGSYTLTVTGTAGAVTQTRDLTFTFTPTTPPAITAQPADVNLCDGGNATFTVTSTVSGLNYQWQVSTDGGTTWTDVPGANASSYTINSVTSTLNNNRYRAILSTQCGTNTSNAAILQVNPAANITTQPVSNSVCQGATVALSAQATGSNLTYQWQISTDGGTTYSNIPGATGLTLNLGSVTPAQNGNRYRLVITSTGGGCPGTVTSDVSLLTVNATPSVAATASANSVCSGTPVTLTASGASTYSWNPGGLSGASITVTPAVDPGNPGSPVINNYTVTGTDVNGCTASFIVTVTVNPLPVVSITASPDIRALFPGLSTTLTANVTPINPNTTYQWLLNGNPISGATQPTLFVNVDGLGSYSVEVTIEDACSATSQNSIQLTDSLTTEIFIYPNPNNGVFQVRYNDRLNGVSNPRSMVIYDSKGARVFVKAYTVNQTFGRMDVDLRHLSGGVYFVELLDAAGIRLQRGKVVIRP